MLLTLIRSQHLGIYLTPIRLPHKAMIISHQSDCHTRVCISHQSYHSIWLSCTNRSVWVLFSCNWYHGIRGWAQRTVLTRNFGLIWWPSLEPHRLRLSFSGYEWFAFNFYIILKLKHVFPLLYSQRIHQTAYIGNRSFRTKDFSHKSFSTSFGPFAQFLVVISHNNHKWETSI